jgi:hypothetical protein
VEGKLYEPFVDGSGKLYYIKEGNILYLIASVCAGHYSAVIQFVS